MKKEELRPVRVTSKHTDEVIHGLFHCWGGLSEHAYAIVEVDTGRIFRLSTYSNTVEFLDVQEN